MNEILHGIKSTYPTCKNIKIQSHFQQGLSPLATFFQASTLSEVGALIGEIGSLTALFSVQKKILNRVSFALPILLLAGKAKTQHHKDGIAFSSLTWIEDHLILAAPVIIAIHATVLIGKGQVLRGGTALAVIAYCQFGPSGKPDPIQKGLAVASIIGSLFFGNWLNTIPAAYFTLGNLGTWTAASSPPPFSPPSLPSTLIMENMETHPYHMQAYRESFPKKVNKDIDLHGYYRLITDLIKDGKADQAISKALSEDPKWKAYPKKETPSQYIETGITKLVEILEGLKNAPLKFGKEDPALIKAIALLEKLQSLPQNDQRPILIDLAIGAYYCPSGLMQTIETTYAFYCDAPEDLFGQINKVLATVRLQIFQNIIKNAFDAAIKPFSYLLPATDQHTYNFMANAYVDELGLPYKDSIEKDLSISGDFLTPYLYRKTFFGLAIEARFLSHYTPYRIIQEVQLALKSVRFEGTKPIHQIKPHLISQWLKEKYPNMNDRIQCLDEDTGQIKPFYLMLLLYDLGFIRSKTLG